MVFPEVDGFGVAPLSCTLTSDGLHVNMRLPPGLSPGRHEARVKIGTSFWSDAWEFFVDLSPIRNDVELVSVQDGVSWRKSHVD